MSGAIQCGWLCIPCITHGLRVAVGRLGDVDGPVGLGDAVVSWLVCLHLADGGFSVVEVHDLDAQGDVGSNQALGEGLGALGVQVRELEEIEERSL